MKNNLVKILVQGGLASIALISLYFYYQTVTNHIDHSNQAILQQAVSNEKMSGSLDRLTAILDKKLR